MSARLWQAPFRSKHVPDGLCASVWHVGLHHGGLSGPGQPGSAPGGARPPHQGLHGPDFRPVRRPGPRLSAAGAADTADQREHPELPAGLRLVRRGSQRLSGLDECPQSEHHGGRLWPAGARGGADGGCACQPLRAGTILDGALSQPALVRRSALCAGTERLPCPEPDRQHHH